MQPKPEFFLIREAAAGEPAGAIVPLIPLDQLPSWVSFPGVPRGLTAKQTRGMKNLGLVPVPGGGGAGPPTFSVRILHQQYQIQHQNQIQLQIQHQRDQAGKAGDDKAGESGGGDGGGVLARKAAVVAAAATGANNPALKRAPLSPATMTPASAPAPTALEGRVGYRNTASAPPAPAERECSPVPLGVPATFGRPLVHTHQTQQQQQPHNDTSPKPSVLDDRVVVVRVPIGNGDGGAGHATTASRNWAATADTGPLTAELRDDGHYSHHYHHYHNGKHLYKNFCRHYCHHGVCKWGRQCRFRHEMPHTHEGMEEVGLRDYPQWYYDEIVARAGMGNHHGSHRNGGHGSLPPSAFDAPRPLGAIDAIGLIPMSSAPAQPWQQYSASSSRFIPPYRRGRLQDLERERLERGEREEEQGRMLLVKDHERLMEAHDGHMNGAGNGTNGGSGNYNKGRQGRVATLRGSGALGNGTTEKQQHHPQQQSQDLRLIHQYQYQHQHPHQHPHPHQRQPEHQQGGRGPPGRLQEPLQPSPAMPTAVKESLLDL